MAELKTKDIQHQKAKNKLKYTALGKMRLKREDEEIKRKIIYSKIYIVQPDNITSTLMKYQTQTRILVWLLKVILLLMTTAKFPS